MTTEGSDTRDEKRTLPEQLRYDAARIRVLTDKGWDWAHIARCEEAADIIESLQAEIEALPSPTPPPSEPPVENEELVATKRLEKVREWVAAIAVSHVDRSVVQYAVEQIASGRSEPVPLGAPQPTPEPPVVGGSRRFTFTCQCGYRPTRPVTLGELQDLKAIHGKHGIRNRKGWKAEEVTETACVVKEEPCPACGGPAVGGGGPSEERLRELAAKLREASTVLDEPFHHDAIAATLNEAAEVLDVR